MVGPKSQQGGAQESWALMQPLIGWKHLAVTSHRHQMVANGHVSLKLGLYHPCGMIVGFNSIHPGLFEAGKRVTMRPERIYFSLSTRKTFVDQL